VFAQTFLEVLEANDGVLLGRDVFRQLRLRVHALAQRWEVPQVPEYAPMNTPGMRAAISSSSGLRAEALNQPRPR
jgi:hypothetical protein